MKPEDVGCTMEQWELAELMSLGQEMDSPEAVQAEMDRMRRLFWGEMTPDLAIETLDLEAFTCPKDVMDAYIKRIRQYFSQDDWEETTTAARLVIFKRTEEARDFLLQILFDDFHYEF